MRVGVAMGESQTATGSPAIAASRFSTDDGLCDADRDEGGHLRGRVEGGLDLGEEMVRLLLSSIGQVRVLPLLVCWGPDVVDLPNGWTIIEGVVVVIGRQAADAFPLAFGGDQTMSPPEADCALEQIDAFMNRRDLHNRVRERNGARRVGPLGGTAVSLISRNPRWAEWSEQQRGQMHRIGHGPCM